MKKILGAAIAAVALSLVLAGCAGTSGNPSPSATATRSSTPSADDLQGGTQPGTLTPVLAFADTPEISGYCPLDVKAVHLHQLPVKATDAMVCASSVGDTDGSVVTTVSKVTGGLDELIKAYSVPNAPVNKGVICTLQLEDPLLVWLTYPGERNYPVYAPVDECGFPTPEAKQAYTALTLQPIAKFTTGADGTVTTTIIN